jgi:hypothetical protein
MGFDPLQQGLEPSCEMSSIQKADRFRSALYLPDKMSTLQFAMYCAARISTNLSQALDLSSQGNRIKKGSFCSAQWLRNGPDPCSYLSLNPISRSQIEQGGDLRIIFVATKSGQV